MAKRETFCFCQSLPLEEEVDANSVADGRGFYGHTYFTLPAFTQNAKGCIIYTVSVRRSALQILQKELQRTMEPTDRNAAKPRLTRAQWKRRKRLRLARNWAILILDLRRHCGADDQRHPLAAAKGERHACRAAEL